MKTSSFKKMLKVANNCHIHLLFFLITMKYNVCCFHRIKNRKMRNFHSSLERFKVVNLQNICI